MAPIRIARGVQNVVLEAMPVTVPVVATSEFGRELVKGGGSYRRQHTEI